MVSTCRRLPAGVLLLGVSLLLPASAQSQHKKKGPGLPGPHGAGKGPNPMQKMNVAAKFEEAEALKEAFVLLALANKDYGGHKAKAQHSVKHAYHTLDAAVRKHGNAAQKAASQQEDVLAEAARQAGKRLPKKHEDQLSSDVQLAKAAELLTQVHAAVVQRKHVHVVPHVEAAILEIQAALTVR